MNQSQTRSRCHFLASTGTCKFGATCKFSHAAAAAAAPSFLSPSSDQHLSIVHKDNGSLKATLASHDKDGHAINESLEVDVSRKALIFACALDVSGSMSGAPLREAAAALEKLYRDVMQGSDKFGLATFGTNVTKLFRPIERSKVDWRRAAQNITANGGGRTALWDGIDWAITAAAMEYEYAKVKNDGRDPDVVTEVIIITDGCDNASTKTTLDKLVLRLAKPGIPNFNFMVVGLGDVDSAALEKLCGPMHCRLVPCESLDVFKAALDRAVESIRVRLVITRREQGATHVDSFDMRGAKHTVATIIAGARVPGQLIEAVLEGQRIAGQRAADDRQGNASAAAAATTPAATKPGSSSSSTPCRTFKTPEGCVYGAKCFFKHA